LNCIFWLLFCPLSVLPYGQKGNQKL
jgi:hypothetical protein